MGKLYRFFYVLLLIGLFLAEFFHPIMAINVDLGRHLLLGKIIATTQHIPRTNLLSYTYQNFPYINTSWLTDVLYYYLFVAGRFDLLLLVNTILIAFAFGLLVFPSIKKFGLHFATLFGIPLYLLLLGLRPDVRPEVISMVCISLFMSILFSYRKNGGWKIFFLMPIELFWVNVHIYFFVGPLLITLFFVDDLIKHHLKFSKAKKYVVVLIGTILATIVNPNTIQGALFPLTVLKNYGFPVVENQSIPTLFSIYHSSEIMLPVIVIMLLFAILFLARKNTHPIDWLLAIVFSLATIFIFRNILLFVFVTYASFTTQLNFLSKKYSPLIKKFPLVSYFLVYPVSLLFLIIFITTSISKNGIGFGSSAYGKSAVDFLLAHHIQGPIYNNFDIGDYLSYRIYPQLVFVDNRPEAYPASFFQNTYIPMQNNPDIFKKLDQKYHFNAIDIEYWDNIPWGYRLLRYLVISSNFKIVYLDQYTVVLVRNTSSNKQLITNFLITKKSLHVTTVNNPQELIHYLFFFEKVGWREQETMTLNVMRENDPELCMLTQYPIEKTTLSRYITKYHLAKHCFL